MAKITKCSIHRDVSPVGFVVGNVYKQVVLESYHQLTASNVHNYLSLSCIFAFIPSILKNLFNNLFFMSLL